MNFLITSYACVGKSQSSCICMLIVVSEFSVEVENISYGEQLCICGSTKGFPIHVLPVVYL